ncbi:tyrosine-type recombinase/integrase [Rhodovulum sulfidophilum]|nr:tyrosine-type recombinase/integrase [Rhodovulum sulfidophilum]
MRRGIVSLTGIFVVRRRGKVYTYYRTKGQPLVRLPDLPHDHPDFLTAYAEARRTKPKRKGRPAGTVGALAEAAMRTDTFKTLSDVYRATLHRHFDAITRTAGDAPARGLRPKHVQKNVIEAASPTDRLKAWRFLAAHGMAAALLDLDPTVGVRAPRRRKTVGHPPWTPDEVDAYRARWPVGTVPRLAFELMHWTGARLSDAVRLGPGMVDRGGVLTFRQSKTRDPAYIPWTCPLPAWATTLADEREQMHRAIAATPGGQMTYLATARGQTRSSKALGTLIREAARAAGIEKSAHGLRKARAVALAEAGATTHQIAAWTGHVSLKEVEHYTRATRRRAAVVGIEQERNVANTSAQSEKHGEK